MRNEGRKPYQRIIQEQIFYYNPYNSGGAHYCQHIAELIGSR